MPSVFSPAKINLYLAVTGRRPDGFHDLVSLAAPLVWGDRIEIELDDRLSLTCDHPGLPTGDDNLIVKAVRSFQAAAGVKRGARIHLEKRIRMGAGLGGGSGNAAAVLMALNDLLGRPLTPAALGAVAAGIGSDCSLFLHRSPVIMRGRGERIEPLDPVAAGRIRGRRVLLFMPSFSVSTPWAFGRLAALAAGTAGPSGDLLRPAADSPAYVEPSAAEKRLLEWQTGTAPAERILFNNLELPVFQKFPALPLMLSALKRDFGIESAMTGSGSCCFALLPAHVPAQRVAAAAGSIREAFGPGAFIVETALA